MSNKQPVKLDYDKIADLGEIFRQGHRNNDRSLTQLELGSFFRSLVDALIQKADTNNNGFVKFLEFIELVASELLSAKSPYTDNQLRQLFQMFDRHGNGFITTAELTHSIVKLGHALTTKELTGIINEADTDGDGRINFHEFSHAITSAAFDSSWS